jgi:hypothetical protein
MSEVGLGKMAACLLGLVLLHVLAHLYVRFARRPVERWVALRLGRAHRSALQLAVLSGSLGGLLGSLFAGPFIAVAYLADNDGLCLDGPLLACPRFLWTVLATAVAGVTLGWRVSLRLYRVCAQQVRRAGGDLRRLQTISARVARFAACCIGGIEAAAIAGLFVGVGSALQGGEVILVNRIVIAGSLGAALISLGVIGAFRRFRTSYVVGYVEFATLQWLATGSTQIPDRAASWIDAINDRTFTCGLSADLYASGQCVAGVALGSLLYALVIGLTLSGIIGVDAVTTRPDRGFFAPDHPPGTGPV